MLSNLAESLLFIDFNIVSNTWNNMCSVISNSANISTDFYNLARPYYNLNCPNVSACLGIVEIAGLIYLFDPISTLSKGERVSRPSTRQTKKIKEKENEDTQRVMDLVCKNQVVVDNLVPGIQDPDEPYGAERAVIIDRIRPLSFKAYLELKKVYGDQVHAFIAGGRVNVVLPRATDRNLHRVLVRTSGPRGNISGVWIKNPKIAGDWPTSEMVSLGQPLERGTFYAELGISAPPLDPHIFIKKKMNYQNSSSPERGFNKSQFRGDSNQRHTTGNRTATN